MQKIKSMITLAALLLPTVSILADDAASTPPAPAPQPDSSFMGQTEGYFQNWFKRVSKTQAEQPHWVTPLSTVTPRLEEELRYDQSWQSVPGHHTLQNFDGNKGLELIPAEKIEVIIGIPAYETENLPQHKNGWTDETFLIKYRILSANKENGDYILTAFFGLSVPSGSANYTSEHYGFTPTIAFGKGWGDFDFQSTLGVSVPDDGSERTGPGTPVLWNTAFQYHIEKYFWPEVEANYTYYPDGKHEGLNQLFITPGLVLGRFPLFGRVGLTVGAGVQVAVTDTPLVHRNIILSGRIPF